MSSPSTQKSVRLSEKTVEVIHEVSKDKINYSGSINSIAERYRLMVTRDLPMLTKPEKLAVMRAYRGRVVPLHDIEREVDMLPLQVSRSFQSDVRLRALVEQAFDIEGFIDHIHKWSFGERMAVLHHVLAVWNKEPAEDDGLN